MSDLTTFIVSQLLCALWLIILAGLLKITVHTPKVNRFFSIETFPLYVNYKTWFFYSSDLWPSLCLGHRIEQKNKVYSLVCGPLSEVRGIYSCIKNWCYTLSSNYKETSKENAVEYVEYMCQRSDYQRNERVEIIYAKVLNLHFFQLYHLARR